MGLITIFEVLLPPIIDGTFLELIWNPSGRVSLGGLFVCTTGIFFCSWEGISKEIELSEEAKQETIQEFNFTKGIAVALFSGVMSSCFALAVQYGDPVHKLAEESAAR